MGTKEVTTGRRAQAPLILGLSFLVLVGPAAWLSGALGEDGAVQITHDTSTDRNPTWSPDGSQIAFDSPRGPNWGNLWVIPSAGGTASQITNEPIDVDTDPDWSSTDQIAFASERDQLFYIDSIWTIPAGGGNAVRITQDLFIEYNAPAWSPDASRIAYQSDPTEGWDIWTIPAAGGTAAQITSDPSDDKEPSWSPSGDEIAFSSSRSGNYDIWRIPAGGGAATQITSHMASDTEPAWSPDGTQLAFVSTRSGNSDVWVIPALGGTAVQITSDTSSDREPSWSPDGTRLAFASFRSGNWDIWTVTLESTAVEEESWGEIKAKYWDR